MPLATRRDIGQFLIGSFPGMTIPVELRSLAREFDLGGVILFSRNIEVPEQVAELSAESEWLGRTMPAWVSVDQEGGRVARLKEPFTRWPPMATLGRAGQQAEPLAERFAKALAAELLAVGITLDYAPVLDIHTNPKNPVIGDRALAERAQDVSKLGRVIIRTLQGAGLAACGKHFPGHGDTSTDSHVELPLVEHAPDRLRAIEFEPFRAAI
ncbi:MAG: glycoside hydrolase family 3 N-terminal domain-containing protein, partial [Vicinamibacterales bacterium]